MSYNDWWTGAPDKATWDSWAVAQGILVNDEPAPGVFPDRIDVLVTTPGEYDENGDEITPPVISPNYHVNVRVDMAKAPEVNQALYQWVLDNEPTKTWPEGGAYISDTNNVFMLVPCPTPYKREYLGGSRPTNDPPEGMFPSADDVVIKREVQKGRDERDALDPQRPSPTDSKKIGRDFDKQGNGRGG